MWISVATFEIIKREHLRTEARAVQNILQLGWKTTEMYACIAEVFGAITFTEV